MPEINIERKRGPRTWVWVLLVLVLVVLIWLFFLRPAAGAMASASVVATAALPDGTGPLVAGTFENALPRGALSDLAGVA